MKILKIAVLVFVIFGLFNLISSTRPINALEIGPDCPSPRYIPTACDTPYRPNRSPGYTADLSCTAAKFADPKNNCCPNRCVDINGESADPGIDLPSEYTKWEVFGTSIRINPENFGTLINLAFTTVLGLISLYVILRGIYVAGVKRPNATNEEDIANISKELTNLIIGFAICWAFIIVIQLLANFLGIGELSNMNFSSGDGTLIITIN